jgi:hypothetical protein
LHWGRSQRSKAIRRSARTSDKRFLRVLPGSSVLLRGEAVSRGWEDPTGTPDAAQNRRVEVQWFTVE